MTDTGSLVIQLTRPETFEITAKLVRSGLDAVRVHQQVYDTFSESRLRLLGHAISNRMLVFDDYATAIIQLSKEDLSNYNFQIGDTEGVVNYPLSMEKINMAVLITREKRHHSVFFPIKGCIFCA